MEIVDKLRERFPDHYMGHKVFRDEPYVGVRKDGLRDVCRWLKETPGMEFDYPVEVTAVDYLGDVERFEVIHVLWSMRHRRRVVLKSRVTEAAAARLLG